MDNNFDNFIQNSISNVSNLCTCSKKNYKALSLNGWVNISYKDWRPININEEQYPLVICVHGLTRNCSDFDYIGSYLSSYHKYRVLSVDVPGRGDSSNLKEKEEYSYPTYIQIIKEWLIGIINNIFLNEEPKIYWIGTSMGGLIGIMLSASLKFCLISKLILNDIGPFVPATAIKRLQKYAGDYPIFNSFEEAKNYLRKIYSPFEPLSNEEWDFITRNSWNYEDKVYKLRYDPLITHQLAENNSVKDMDIFVIWEKIPKDTLVMVIRGETSDILLKETINKMKNSGPGIKKELELPKVGHAPMLLSKKRSRINSRILKLII